MDYKIVKAQQEDLNPAVYEVKYIIDAVNEAGETVKVIDPNRSERVTLAQIDENIANYQKIIDELKAKKTAISTLETPSK